MFTIARAYLKQLGLYEFVAFITGFVLMAYELAAARLLAPSIGTSTYVWTSIIGVMIAALAIGYAAGGWIADRRAAKPDICWLLLAAAVAVVCSCLFYEDVLGAIVTLFGDPRVQGVAASLLLFAPASFLLGMISPYLARLRVQSVKTTGRSVAGLSALNSIGGITGTFAAGFVFFSTMGSQETLALLAAVLIITSWLIAPRYRVRLRAVASIILLVIMLLQFSLPARAGVVASIDTPTSSYKVLDIMYRDRPVRVLTMGPGGLQSGVFLDGSKTLAFDYTRKIAQLAVATPHKNRVLILGGGAFTLPEYLGRHNPQSQVDVVELDPQLPEIARQYFSYTPSDNVRTISQDARTYLQAVQEPYDLIIVDVYNDASVPFALTTQEYVRELSAALTPEGTVLVNIIASGAPQCMPLLASIHGSYVSAFGHSLVYPLGDPTFNNVQNIIAAYSKAPLSWAANVPGSAFIALRDGQVLTDNFAPVEPMVQRCK